MDESARKPLLRNVVSLPGTGRPETVIGVTHTYRLEEQQSGGALACIEVVVKPDHGIPPHSHHLGDETFYVIEGTVEITGDDLAAGPTNLSRGNLFYRTAIGLRWMSERATRYALAILLFAGVRLLVR
jgi:quercetin dioxygenase-like cupin family protein